MAASRLLLSALLLATLAAGAGALVALQPRGGGPAEVPLTIEGPGGERLFEGVVQVEEATALHVLLAAAAQAGFEVETRTYAGLGTYVSAIGGHRAHGEHGWIYEVRAPGGDWTSGDRSAASYPLVPGESLRWRWV